MSKALEEITKEASQLPRPQRIALAGFLLELDDDGDEVEVEAAWEKEILARIRAVDDGTAVGIAYTDVMREAQKRLGQ